MVSCAPLETVPSTTVGMTCWDFVVAAPQERSFRCTYRAPPQWSRSKGQRSHYAVVGIFPSPLLLTGGNHRNTRAHNPFGTSADNGPVTHETRQSPGHHRLWEEGSIFLEEQIIERRKALSILRAVRIEEAAVRQSLFVQYGSAPRGAKALSTVENQEYDVHESS